MLFITYDTSGVSATTAHCSVLSTQMSNSLQWWRVQEKTALLLKIYYIFSNMSSKRIPQQPRTSQVGVKIDLKRVYWHLIPEPNHTLLLQDFKLASLQLKKRLHHPRNTQKYSCNKTKNGVIQHRNEMKPNCVRETVCR